MVTISKQYGHWSVMGCNIGFALSKWFLVSSGGVWGLNFGVMLQISFRCLILLSDALFRQRLNEGFTLRIMSMTSSSLRSVFSLISSNVIRSAHAAQITQSTPPRVGSGFLVLVVGRFPVFRFISYISHHLSTIGLSAAARLCLDYISR